MYKILHNGVYFDISQRYLLIKIDPTLEEGTFNEEVNEGISLLTISVPPNTDNTVLPYDTETTETLRATAECPIKLNEYTYTLNGLQLKKWTVGDIFLSIYVVIDSVSKSVVSGNSIGILINELEEDRNATLINIINNDLNQYLCIENSDDFTEVANFDNIRLADKSQEYIRDNTKTIQTQFSNDVFTTNETYAIDELITRIKETYNDIDFRASIHDSDPTPTKSYVLYETENETVLPKRVYPNQYHRCYHESMALMRFTFNLADIHKAETIRYQYSNRDGFFSISTMSAPDKNGQDINFTVFWLPLDDGVFTPSNRENEQDNFAYTFTLRCEIHYYIIYDRARLNLINRVNSLLTYSQNL